jgi:hypothetical protein
MELPHPKLLRWRARRHGRQSSLGQRSRASTLSKSYPKPAVKKDLSNLPPVFFALTESGIPCSPIRGGVRSSGDFADGDSLFRESG